MNMELINQIIGYEPNINIGVTSEELKNSIDNENRNIEVLDKDLNTIRFYHFIVMDKKFEIKPLFRALRNGGYLISLVKFNEEFLQNTGFSAVSEIDGLQIAKKVFSWNDW